MKFSRHYFVLMAHMSKRSNVNNALVSLRQRKQPTLALVIRATG